MWKETLMTIRKIESWKWPGRTEENKDYPQASQSLCRDLTPRLPALVTGVQWS